MVQLSKLHLKSLSLAGFDKTKPINTQLKRSLHLKRSKLRHLLEKLNLSCDCQIPFTPSFWCFRADGRFYGRFSDSQSSSAHLSSSVWAGFHLMMNMVLLMGCFEFLTSFVILAFTRKLLKCHPFFRSGFGSSLRFHVSFRGRFVMKCESLLWGVQLRWGQGTGFCSGSWSSFTLGLAKAWPRL